jgi:manganese efflux pump family protein
LATGLIFVPFGNLIYTAVGIIALGSFLFTIVGCVIGIMFGKKFKINVELIGGIILFGIGTKILVEHLIQGC